MFLPLLLAGGGALAVSLGEIEVASHMGEPLRVRVPITLDGEAALPLAGCVRLAGPRHPELAGARLALISRGDRRFIEIETDKPVSNPMLDLTLRTQGCGASLQKDYVILLSPRDFAPPPTTLDVPVARPDTPAQVSRASKAKRAGKVGKRASAGTARRAGQGPRTSAPAAQGPHLVLKADESIEFLPPVPPAPVAPEAAPPASTPVPVPTPAALPAPRPWYAGLPMSYLLVPLVLILVAFVVALWLKRRDRHDRYGPENLPAMHTQPFFEMPKPVPATAAVAEPPAPPEAPEPAMVNPIFGEPIEVKTLLDETAEPEPEPAATPTPAPVPAPSNLAIEALGMQPAAAPRSTPTEETTPDGQSSLDHVMELAEVMLAFGRNGQAIETLSRHIRSHPRQSVDPWLKLLDLYHQSDLRTEFEALSTDLHNHYNIATTEWDHFAVGPRDDFQPTLENLPHVMSRVVENWGTQAGLDYIEKLLADNRGGQRLGFSMAIVRDILLLRNIQRQICPLPARPQ
jgi:hypothetical protein